MAGDRIIGRIFQEAASVEKPILESTMIAPNKLKMIAILQDCDRPNRNNRVYPKSVVSRALETPYILEKLATCSLAGEMNHPPSGCSMARQMTIDMTNVSHYIRRVWWDEKDKGVLLGEVHTASTRVGIDFFNMITLDNMLASFSMRGGGDVTRKGGYDHVKDPLRLLTWDSVHFPSHKAAYMQQRLDENAIIPVTESMLVDYLSSKSDNFQQLSESVDCFLGDEYKLKLGENGIIQIVDSVTNNTAAYSILEENLRMEYFDAVGRL